MRRVILLLGSALLLQSCNNRQQPQQLDNATANTTITKPPSEAFIQHVYQKGVIIPSIPVYQQSADSFAVYLPQSYDSTSPSAIIIFLDELGESTKVLEQYKSLAEKHNYIIACSSINFNKSTAVTGILSANALINDLQSRFNLNKNKTIVAGFGSGAKIGIDAACGNAAVNAIVYTGSVLLWGNLNHKISFLGFAGTKDMNYSELISFNESKYLQDKEHYLIEFNGSHQWPDAKIFEAAFLFPYNTIPKQKLYVLTDTQKQKLETEKQLRQSYYNAITGQNISWWKTQITELKGKKKGDPMYGRILDLISLSCYKLSQTNLQANNLTAAEKVITVYGLIDPENKDYKAFVSDLNYRTARNKSI